MNVSKILLMKWNFLKLELGVFLRQKYKVFANVLVEIEHLHPSQPELPLQELPLHLEQPRAQTNLD